MPATTWPRAGGVRRAGVAARAAPRRLFIPPPLFPPSAASAPTAGTEARNRMGAVPQFSGASWPPKGAPSDSYGLSATSRPTAGRCRCGNVAASSELGDGGGRGRHGAMRATPSSTARRPSAATSKCPSAARKACGWDASSAAASPPARTTAMRCRSAGSTITVSANPRQHAPHPVQLNDIPLSSFNTAFRPAATAFTSGANAGGNVTAPATSASSPLSASAGLAARTNASSSARSAAGVAGGGSKKRRRPGGDDVGDVGDDDGVELLPCRCSQLPTAQGRGTRRCRASQRLPRRHRHSHRHRHHHYCGGCVGGCH